MQFSGKGIKPCAHCLRARQVVKDGLGRVFQRPATHIEYTTPDGPILVDATAHRIVGTPGTLGHWQGIEVYAAKGVLTNIGTTAKLTTYSRSRKLHMPGKVLATTT